MSAMMLASAGQFAGIVMIAVGAGYLEMAMTTMIVNLRYLLMSSALSQKIERGKPFYHRLLMAYAVTDELFGISISVEGRLNPCYLYGAASIAAPGWVLGTFLGAVIGMILPVRVMNFCWCRDRIDGHQCLVFRGSGTAGDLVWFPDDYFDDSACRNLGNFVSGKGGGRT